MGNVSNVNLLRKKKVSPNSVVGCKLTSFETDKYMIKGGGGYESMETIALCIL